ncbi:PqqD family protein [Actinacidiphila sp. SB3-2]
MRDLTPSPTVYATVTERGAMLLDIRRRGRWYALSASGALWWRHLEAGLTVDEAAARVAEQYGVSAERVQKDMHQLAHDLRNRKILRPTRRGRQR